MSLNNAPCKDCTERFPACSDRCPKDARGEYGYKAWKADHQKAKDAEREYRRKRREDYLMSEECESTVVKWRNRQRHGR